MDSLVVGIVRMVRRESRRSQAIRWSIADGTSTLPLVDYTYQVNGQSHEGSATGLPIKDDQINQIGDVIDSVSTLRVRYDPAKPERNRILNEDNPRIPFEIDHLKR